MAATSRCHASSCLVRRDAFVSSLNTCEIYSSPGVIWGSYKTRPSFLSRPGPNFCLLLGVSSDYAQPIIGQVTCHVIGWAQPELTPSKRQKTGPGTIAPPYQISQSLILYSWSTSVFRIQSSVSRQWQMYRNGRLCQCEFCMDISEMTVSYYPYKYLLWVQWEFCMLSWYYSFTF